MARAGFPVGRFAMSDFEIVRREDFSDVTYLLEVRHPLMAQAARPGQFVIVMLERARRAHSAHDRRLRPRARHDHARHPGGRQDDAEDAAGLPRRHAPVRAGRPDGHPQPRSATRRKVVCVGGGLGVAPIFPAGPRLQGGRRLRDRRPRLSHQGLVFWEDKFRLLRRTHPVHQRRLGRHARASSPTASRSRSHATPTSTRWSRSARR